MNKYIAYMVLFDFLFILFLFNMPFLSFSLKLPHPKFRISVNIFDLRESLYSNIL